ncbi:MAG: transposase [Patescibacteria group bacterium]
MSRPLRIEYSGALHHVISRGNGRMNIFLKDADRKIFLQILGETIERHHWLCHAYCLMDNHYHLLIETPEANLSVGMRQLNGRYSQRFNHFHKRVGHLFQSRYQSFLVEKDAYLLEVARYIVLNPVRAGMVASPADWKWSSFLDSVGMRQTPTWLTTTDVLGFFGGTMSSRRELYEQYVLEGVKKEYSLNIEQVGNIVGSSKFVEYIGEELEGFVDKEIPKEQRLIGRPTLLELFGDEVPKDKTLRDELICLAYNCGEYSQKKIADYVGLHYTRVSQIILREKNSRFTT